MSSQRGGRQIEAWARVSTRRLEYLRLLADGLSNVEIGERLWVTVDTVRSTLRQLYREIGAANRAHAVTIGFRQGWLT